MVKNTSGGTRTKGLARKHVNSSNTTATTIRLPDNELEQIVYVNKMLGNGMCEVYNNDDVRLIAHIRNKFRGRHKRSNNINANSYILIGLREWETPYKNCDVIFVYDDHHFNTIRNLPHLPILNIINRNNEQLQQLQQLHDFTFIEQQPELLPQLTQTHTQNDNLHNNHNNDILHIHDI